MQPAVSRSTCGCLSCRSLKRLTGAAGRSGPTPQAPLPKAHAVPPLPARRRPLPGRPGAGRGALPAAAGAGVHCGAVLPHRPARLRGRLLLRAAGGAGQLLGHGAARPGAQHPVRDVEAQCVMYRRAPGIAWRGPGRAAPHWLVKARLRDLAPVARRPPPNPPGPGARDARALPGLPAAERRRGLALQRALRLHGAAPRAAALRAVCTRFTRDRGRAWLRATCCWLRNVASLLRDGDASRRASQLLLHPPCLPPTPPRRRRSRRCRPGGGGSTTQTPSHTRCTPSPVSMRRRAPGVQDP